MTDLSIGDDTFRIEVEGDATKPALLLSHSLGADLSQWDAQMPALLKSFRVIRYDSRGHGGSSGAGAPYSIARLGRDALGILDALDIKRAHVIGLSMGGAVAQWLLANAPHRIERAVLANTSARFGSPESWNARIVGVLNQGMAGISGSTMDRWFGADFTGREPQRVEAVRAVFEATSPEGYAASCAAIRDFDLREGLRGITTPVLVVSGHDDPSISDADTAHLVSAIEGARHTELTARHISNIEADAAFSKAVVGFLTARLPVKPAARKPTPQASGPKGAKAIVTRRVGTRRSTAARSPLAAPTRTSASVKPTKTPDTVKKVSPAKASPAKPARAKQAAAAAPAKRAAPKPPVKAKAKPTAIAKTSKPVAKPAAKPKVAPKKAVAAKSAPKVVKRPSAKSLKAMAGGAAKTPTNIRATKPASTKPAGTKASKTKAAPIKTIKSKVNSTKATTSKTPTAKAKMPPVRKAKAAVKAPTRIKASPKMPAKPAPRAKAKVVAKAPIRAKAPAKPQVKKSAKPGRRAS